MAVCAVFTFTRIVWLGGVVALLVLGSGKTRAALLVIPVLVVLAFVLLPSVQQRFEGATETTGYESSGAWRIRHWDDQLRYNSLPSLPLGAGLGTVEHVLGQPAHNDYLRIWVEMGVLGSAAYLWLYGSVIKGAVGNYRGARTSEDRFLVLAFLALLTGRLVMSLTDNLLIQPVLEWYFWGIAAVVLALKPRNGHPGRAVPVHQRGRP
jgi:O-antigen ligase